jgi:uncharacterized protein
MLELRPNCECCDRDLAIDDATVVICSFECTWCADCAERMQHLCPNCGGGLVPRPIRPAAKLLTSPASMQRVVTEGCLERIG